MKYLSLSRLAELYALFVSFVPAQVNASSIPGTDVVATNTNYNSSRLPALLEQYSSTNEYPYTIKEIIKRAANSSAPPYINDGTMFYTGGRGSSSVTIKNDLFKIETFKEIVTSANVERVFLWGKVYSSKRAEDIVKACANTQVKELYLLNMDEKTSIKFLKALRNTKTNITELHLSKNILNTTDSYNADSICADQAEKNKAEPNPNEGIVLKLIMVAAATLYNIYPIFDGSTSTNKDDSVEKVGEGPCYDDITASAG